MLLGEVLPFMPAVRSKLHRQLPISERGAFNSLGTNGTTFTTTTPVRDPHETREKEHAREAHSFYFIFRAAVTSSRIDRRDMQKLQR